MDQMQAQRRLVKSPPELWAELSDEDTLGRHLAEFGSIRVVQTDPETTVAWEGERASGTVEIEATGWGTKVTLSAEPVAAEPETVPTDEPEPAPIAEPEPAVEPPLVGPEVLLRPPDEPAPASPAVEPPRWGFFSRLLGRRRAPAPAPQAPAAEVPTPPAPTPDPSPPVPTPDPTPPEPGPAPPAPDPPAPGPQIAVPGDVPAAVIDAARIEQVLTGVLDDLGAAHHRPFSRG